MLSSKSALALSLAIHELATNAAKFGALSRTSGHVNVNWRLMDGHDGLGSNGLGLTWRESGGPQVEPPKRRGFGSSLIERALAMETGGTAKIRYERGGVVCEVSLPATSILKTTEGSSDMRMVEEAAIEPPPAETTRRSRVLLVEDSYLLLVTLEEMFVDFGWDVVGPATRLPDALRLARTKEIDAAFLDVNLDGEMSWEVALALKARGIPFAFSSGYDGASILPPLLADAQILRKPFPPDDIERCIRKMLG
jgi:CheY-like chemotaxis protein